MKNTKASRTVRAIIASGNHRAGRNRQSLVFSHGGIALRTEGIRGVFRQLSLAESFEIYRKLDASLDGASSYAPHRSKYLRMVAQSLAWKA